MNESSIYPAYDYHLIDVQIFLLALKLRQEKQAKTYSQDGLRQTYSAEIQAVYAALESGYRWIRNEAGFAILERVTPAGVDVLK